MPKSLDEALRRVWHPSLWLDPGDRLRSRRRRSSSEDSPHARVAAAMKRYRDRERELRRRWRVKRKRKRSAKTTYKVLALPSPTVEVSSNHETMSKNTVTAAPAIEAPSGSVRVSLVFPPATIAALRASGFLHEGTSE